MKSLIIGTVFSALFLTGCTGHGSKKSSSESELITSILPGATLLIGFNRNEDYEIDRDELDSGKHSSFENADLNSNGVVNLSEFRNWHAKAIGARGALPNFYHFDKDYNDRITRSEFDVGLERLFKAADKNKDKIVGFQELVSIKSPPEPRGRNNTGGRGDKEKRRR